MNFPTHSRGRASLASFTLVEMLVVMAIAVILATLSLMAFRSLTSSSALTTSSGVVSGAFAYARQDAIAKNTCTSVVIMTQAGAPNAYATLSVWEYAANSTSNTGGTWPQATPWKTLPPGIVFDNGTALNSPSISYQSNTQTITTSNTCSYISTAQSAQPFVSSPSSSNVATASISYLGTAVSYGNAGTATSQGYACQTFLPSGRLYSAASTPFTLLLDEGLYNTNGILTYTHLSANNGSQNYAWYFFNITDGQAKIIRP